MVLCKGSWAWEKAWERISVFWDENVSMLSVLQENTDDRWEHTELALERNLVLSWILFCTLHLANKSLYSGFAKTYDAGYVAEGFAVVDVVGVDDV